MGFIFPKPISYHINRRQCASPVQLADFLQWYCQHTSKNQYWTKYTTRRNLCQNKKQVGSRWICRKKIPLETLIQTPFNGHGEEPYYLVGKFSDGIHSRKGLSLVPPAMGLCSCTYGSSGGFCKHQYAVFGKFWVVLPGDRPATD